MELFTELYFDLGGMTEIEEQIVDKEVEDYDSFAGKYLLVNILDNDYLIEIVRVLNVLEDTHIARYTTITNCAFMHVQGETVLAVELRNEKSNAREVKVVVAEVILEGNIMLLGFIVDRAEDFYEKIF